ncbi:hypothetical protein B0G76_1677 [Paraburkholderia sp. BL23I1N1]|nr:hypothetical protein B0G76_1677 [Paraburkholderia sp. BL23I1N1]
MQTISHQHKELAKRVGSIYALNSDPPGVRQKSWTVYAAKQRLSRYSIGLSEPSEILIRFSLYLWM